MMSQQNTPEGASTSPTGGSGTTPAPSPQQQQQQQTSRPRDEAGRFTKSAGVQQQQETQQQTNTSTGKQEQEATPSTSTNTAPTTSDHQGNDTIPPPDYSGLNEDTLKDPKKLYSEMAKIVERNKMLEEKYKKMEEESISHKRKLEEINAEKANLENEKRRKLMDDKIQEMNSLMNKAFSDLDEASKYNNKIQPVNEDYRKGMFENAKAQAQELFEKGADVEEAMRPFHGALQLATCCTNIAKEAVKDNSELLKFIEEQQQLDMRQELLQKFKGITPPTSTSTSVPTRSVPEVPKCTDNLAPPQSRFVDFSNIPLFKSSEPVASQCSNSAAQGQQQPPQESQVMASQNSASAAGTPTGSSRPRADWNTYNSAGALYMEKKCQTYPELMRHFIPEAGRSGLQTQAVQASASSARPGGGPQYPTFNEGKFMEALNNVASMNPEAVQNFRGNTIPSETPSACQKYIGGFQYDIAGVWDNVFKVLDNPGSVNPKTLRESYHNSIRMNAKRLRDQGYYQDAEMLVGAQE